MYNNLFDSIGLIRETDPAVADAIALELKRQREKLELIASENIVSPAVMAAMGSVLTNKYAEGYPSRRYYGGCECVDIVENLAIERAKELFSAEYANVQPHSGSQANFAVYTAFLKPGDTVLGMSLADGGHLTHGAKVNLSGKLYNFFSYGVDENGYIDYDALVFLRRSRAHDHTDALGDFTAAPDNLAHIRLGDRKLQNYGIAADLLGHRYFFRLFDYGRSDINKCLLHYFFLSNKTA